MKFIYIIASFVVICFPTYAQQPDSLDQLLEQVRESVPKQRFRCPISYELASIEDRDAHAEAAASIASGDLRYFSLEGIGLSVPGVAFSMSICASVQMNVKTLIPEHTDQMICDERTRLMQIAVRFAAEYNRLIEAAREEMGVETCAA